MQYRDLVQMLEQIDGQRLTLVVHPDDEQKVAEGVRRIGDEGLGRGQPIIAPRIVASEMANPGQVLVMAPREDNRGR